MKGYNFLSEFHLYSLHPLNSIFVMAFFPGFLCSVPPVCSAQVTLEWQASSGNLTKCALIVLARKLPIAAEEMVEEVADSLTQQPTDSIRPNKETLKSPN